MRVFRQEIIRNPWLLAFLGFLVFASVTVTLNLPSKILIGEKGQAAIQMLDAMRRPFLEIKTAETLLIGAGWTKMAISDFNKAVESGNNLLARYRQLAEYNPELSRRVAQLAEAYEGWLLAERKLFDHFREDSISENSPLLHAHIIKDLHASSAGFLNTMDRLGEGEIPVHEDIGRGRRANHILISLLGGLFIYLISLLFLQQRTKNLELESQVEIRTYDLEEANKSLQQEIAEHKLAERRLLVQYAVSRILIESTTLNEAEPKIIQAVCECVGWDIGILWIVDHKDNVLRCVEHWYSPSVSLSEFEAITRQFTFSKGVGLPGRIWASGKPEWIVNVVKDTNFPRMSYAAKAGLHGAFGFPIVSGGEFLGVIEFFSSEIRQPDDELLQMFTAIGNQIWQFTKRKQAETEIENSLSLLRATIESTADGILIVNDEGKMVGLNQRFIDMWRIPESIVASHDDNQSLAFVLDQLKEPEIFINKVRELYSQPDAESYDILEFKDGRIFERYSRPQYIGGKSVGRVWSFRDITERKEAEEKIKHMAYHDLLTDLPNRALFFDRLYQATLAGQRENGHVALLILDLDGFKEINDTAGHHYGDLVLQAVGLRLRGIVRKSDTVARIGGDEFSLLLPGTNMEGATLTAHKILETIKTPFSLEGQVFNIGVSVGIALFPDHSEDSSLLMQKADMAMYKAKESGRGYALYVSGEDKV